MDMAFCSFAIIDVCSKWTPYYSQNCLHMLTRWYIFIVVLGWGWGSAPCELQRFWLLKKFKVRTHGWMQNWILWNIKKFFLCFELFRARFAYKFVKSANMTPKKCSLNIFNMSIKKQNLIPISNPLKSIKKVYMKKVKGLRTFDTVLKDEKKYIISTLLC